MSEKVYLTLYTMSLIQYSSTGLLRASTFLSFFFLSPILVLKRMEKEERVRIMQFLVLF